MERSFAEEVKQLALGEGQVLRGEGILAITKALLQAGVSYVGGYPGAPVSHLLDVLADANESLLEPMGVYLDASANEAAAAALLGASINYPMRGAVTWKSIVGTNVAADALSNLASLAALASLAERWGGWFVTGSGTVRHLGNQIPALEGRPHELTSVAGLFDANGYRALSSDIAALRMPPPERHSALSPCS
jgi:indolepyruvate ferredoxin oxidoreductase alpha subunit